MNAFAASTVCLGGRLAAKLEAWHGAGGREIGFWLPELKGVREYDIRPSMDGIRVAYIEALADYPGCPDVPLPGDQTMRGVKRNEAAAFLSAAMYWQAPMILVCAPTDLRTDPGRITSDLAELGGWASTMGLRVGYEALPWSRFDNSLPAAYARVLEAGMPGTVQVVIDTWHHLACGGDPAYVREIAVSDIALVQLSDLSPDTPWPTAETVIGTARNLRALPGEGWMTGPMRQMVSDLLDAGYEGVIADETRSRTVRAAPPRSAARWIMTGLGKVAPIWGDMP